MRTLQKKIVVVKVTVVYEGMPSHIDAGKLVLTVKIIETMEKENSKAVVNVEFTYEKKQEGKVIDAISAGAKLTKADAGRTVGSESIIIIIEPKCCDDNNGGCGCPKISIEQETEYVPELPNS